MNTMCARLTANNCTLSQSGYDNDKTLDL